MREIRLTIITATLAAAFLQWQHYLQSPPAPAKTMAACLPANPTHA
jgi:hypothetical protein